MNVSPEETFEFPHCTSLEVSRSEVSDGKEIEQVLKRLEVFQIDVVPDSRPTLVPEAPEAPEISETCTPTFKDLKAPEAPEIPETYARSTAPMSKGLEEPEAPVCSL